MVCKPCEHIVAHIFLPVYISTKFSNTSRAQITGLRASNIKASPSLSPQTFKSEILRSVFHLLVWMT